jgi:hypothetical protein
MGSDPEGMKSEDLAIGFAEADDVLISSGCILGYDNKIN